MLVFKLKRNLATQAEIISTSRIIFNIQPRGKFNFYSLRRLVYSHIYTKQSNGVLILQNRLHKIVKIHHQLSIIKYLGKESSNNLKNLGYDKMVRDKLE